MVNETPAKLQSGRRQGDPGNNGAEQIQESNVNTCTTHTQVHVRRMGKDTLCFDRKREHILANFSNVHDKEGGVRSDMSRGECYLHKRRGDAPIINNINYRFLNALYYYRTLIGWCMLGGNVSVLGCMTNSWLSSFFPVDAPLSSSGTERAKVIRTSEVLISMTS